ncbi:MAG: hypothetical protein ACFFD2_17670 [Promethearchaeota archaeon]
MLNKKIGIIILIAVIIIGILVPVFLLTRRPPDTTPPTIEILSPTNTTYISQTTQITINLNCPDSDVHTIWYRLFNQTGGSWVDPTNITWTSSIPKTLGQGGVYILYAWANDTHGLISSPATVTFTMYHEIIYSGDHVFTSSFTVEPYQKVIFQNGEFSITSGTLVVNEILEMDNVTWASSLTMDADSTVSVTNCTFNDRLYTYGNLVASFNNVIFSNRVYIYENSTISVTDAVFNNYLRTYDSTKLTITNSSLYSFEFNENSEVNISYSSCSNYGKIEHSSSVILRNFTMPPTTSFECWDNSSLTLINSTIYDLYNIIEFYSGNWLIDYNTISGTGSHSEPTNTVIDSTINYIFNLIWVYSTTNILVNNSIYYGAEIYSESNITLYNTTINGWFIATDSSNVTIINSAVNSLWLRTNSTVYLEDVNAVDIYHVFSFYQGDISGYNQTFIGTESWTFPKITMGPNVIYTNYFYQYNIYDQVNFTLTNTSQVRYIYAYDSSNVSLYFCNMPSANVYGYNDVNITCYYSWIYRLAGYDNVNLTIFNSTCDRAYIHGYSFASIINNSHLNYLYIYDSASYYLSPDSTIDNII